MKFSVAEIEREIFAVPVWSIRQDYLAQMLGRLRGVEGGVVDIDVKAAEAAQITSRPVAGGVAQLSLHGPISHRPSLWSFFFGGTSTEGFSKQLREAVADPAVSRIVIDVDSPGGTVDGVPELADELRSARAAKPITAVSNSEAASAAYWIASQASEVVVSPSGEVGSVGVWVLHMDYSRAYEEAGITPTFISAGKYKVEGNPFAPLDDEARAHLQSRVDDYYGMFVRGVAKGRGVSADTVRSDFGEGRMLMADAAVKAKMADRVSTLEAEVAHSRRAHADAFEMDIETRGRRQRLLQLGGVR